MVIAAIAGMVVVLAVFALAIVAKGRTALITASNELGLSPAGRNQVRGRRAGFPVELSWERRLGLTWTIEMETPVREGFNVRLRRRSTSFETPFEDQVSLTGPELESTALLDRILRGLILDLLQPGDQLRVDRGVVSMRTAGRPAPNLIVSRLDDLIHTARAIQGSGGLDECLARNARFEVDEERANRNIELLLEHFPDSTHAKRVAG